MTQPVALPSADDSLTLDVNPLSAVPPGCLSGVSMDAQWPDCWRDQIRRLRPRRALVELRYTVHLLGQPTPDLVTCPVSLQWTVCNFGGHPPWWLSPPPNCRRRVAKLYLVRRLDAATVMA